MTGFAIAAALAALTAPEAAAPAPAPASDVHPAMWLVRDADTTIYLFGTFHALDGKSDWFNGEVRQAFEDSDELVLETLIPDKPLAPVAAPATPTPSFLAATRVALSAGRAKGLNFDKGADVVLRDAAKARGKTVRGLESFAYQLAMFNSLPPAPAAPAPKPGQAVNSTEQLSTLMGSMQDAWKRGDGSVFTDMLAGMRANTPGTYRQLFDQRNSNWAEWVARRLQQPGTVFVAVGAGHLSGPDSVQAKLAGRRITSARID